MRPDLPSGTVTFLFTDVEGSTKLLHELGAKGYAEALAEHRRLIREACAAQGGVEVDTQGDAFFFAFPTAPGAIAAAARFTDALAAGPIQVRVGLHTGTPLLTDEGYIGDDVHFGARVAASSHGGQVILSRSTAELVELELTDLGEHRLKDIPDAVSIYQLGVGAFPPLKTISNTNLPTPASSFVGRDDELLEVLSRFEEGARLVTLTGPGGTGKTRLAIEAAATLVPEYKAGVFWIGLATLRDPALVTETIAQTLGAKDGLADHVGQREMLLLLDNLEQVIGAAPDLSELLTACPNLTLLVTSRELLRIQGEVEYAVPPLAEPEAVSLFCERSGLETSEEIAQLCARLDNLPLAVELAAARASVLTPEQILDRLSQRLDLLKGGRDADPRQATLRATIEWSHELLNEDEQQLFARLAVFAGGCTLEAAEEVCDADLDTLQSLVEKSLLRFTDGRYWMLETIREYAEERLNASSEREVLLGRLGRHLISRAVDEGAPNFLADQSAALARLEPEHPNTRTVMEWALARERYDVALELTGWLVYAWLARGHLDEARRWVEVALVGRAAVPYAVRARALMAASDTLKGAGNLDGAADAAEELVETMTDRPGVDQVLVAGALADLADFAREQSDRIRARKLAERSLEFRIAHDLPGGRAHNSLAELAMEEDDLQLAERHLEAAAGDYARLGHQLNHAATMAELGEVALRRGDLRSAAARFADALHMYAQLGDQGGVGDCLQDLAAVASAQGDVDRAGRLWGAGRALQERIGVTAARERDPGTFPEEARLEGARMSLEEALRCADTPP